MLNGIEGLPRSLEALPQVPGGLGWFLTLLVIVSGSGPLLSVILHYRAKSREATANAQKAENSVVFDEAEATQRIIKAGEDHWAERERRFLERETDLEGEVAECRAEIKEVRVELGDLMAFVVHEQGWHFDDERERRAAGERVKPAPDFDAFMGRRKRFRAQMAANGFSE